MPTLFICAYIFDTLFWENFFLANMRWMQAK